MVVDGAAPTGLLGWITEYGNVVYFFGQLIYWLVICAAAVWATLLFRKFVNARVAQWSDQNAAAGTSLEAVASMPAASASAADAPASAPAGKPSIEEFVD